MNANRWRRPTVGPFSKEQLLDHLVSADAKEGQFMNKFLGLGFGAVRAGTCRPNSLNQAKLVTAIAAMLTLSTTCADAAKRHVGQAPRFAAHDVKVVPIHSASEPSYWMYRRCSPGARAADPSAVCFPPNTVRPYLGRDPDSTVRLQMRRDYFHDNLPATQ
jgi:hypothetical protein